MTGNKRSTNTANKLRLLIKNGAWFCELRVLSSFTLQIGCKKLSDVFKMEI